MHGSTGGLLGRDDERRRIAAVVGAARNGRGSALLLLGEPGVGKSSLVADAVQDAGLDVVRADGFEAESSMPYAAVQRVVGRLTGHLDALPARQREPLLVASGSAEGPPPDRFLVGLGVLSLLAAAGSSRPVLCVADDAHHLDAESLDVLAFVARRLGAERVALLLAGRVESGLEQRLAGMPVLEVGGLAPEPAAAVLNRSAGAPFPPTTTAAIVRATGGNPLALTDLAADPLLRELDGLGLGPDPVPIGSHLEAHYLRRVMHTSAAVQGWLLLAAADSSGDPRLLAEAAPRCGVKVDDGDEAEAAGLVALDPGVRFRHPLVRSAVYRSASGVQRRRVHAALARAAADLGLVEAEAWHASRTVTGVDADVADRLDRAALLAARRGGSTSRAGILTRAAELTPPGPARDVRQVAAAEATLEAGAADVARRLLGTVDESRLDPVSRGRLVSVRSAAAMFLADPEGVRSASADQLRAADAFRGHDPAREQEALLHAFEMCLTAERLVTGTTLEAVGRRVAQGAAEAEGAGAVVLRGIAALMLEPYARAVGPARAALETVLAQPDDLLRFRGTLVAAVGVFLWDERGRARGLDRARRAARRLGDLQRLDTLLWVSALGELSGGTVRRAQEFDDGVREVRRAMGYDGENVVNGAVLAWTGAPAALVEAVAAGAEATGFGGVASSTLCALAVREIAGRDHASARARLDPYVVRDPFLQTSPLFLADHAEAAVRSGHPDAAARSAADLVARADANGSAWCRGLAERALALTSSDDVEQHHAASVAALAATEATVDRARSHLVYGEWLRRARRRREAVAQLQEAVALFDRSGVTMFAARAEAELAAAGGARRPVPTGDDLDLTAQERTVARLAAAGRTNAEIGARLFISPNTVDYHLRKVFQKLGVTSRRQLADRLGPRPTA
ncbi:DNA-binding NarL/FixJ family response regulator [Isoptericola jiangsuensis]|uniref:DNA-binding NarL/FixJ family response regulator n=1 Tax=Isoptericola jiangsuensis TaxID=548579 RepID=A0A2A9ER92_9MICO|nr:LuxR family transcriptional regulator [Isoptericola jiangsuensis]PFG41514.1 DNA-binding NarL/FixJ family response regulator [Isoptericola jiangsuensis]